MAGSCASGEEKPHAKSRSIFRIWRQVVIHDSFGASGSDFHWETPSWDLALALQIPKKAMRMVSGVERATKEGLA